MIGMEMTPTPANLGRFCQYMWRIVCSMCEKAFKPRSKRWTACPKCQQQWRLVSQSNLSSHLTFIHAYIWDRHSNFGGLKSRLLVDRFSFRKNCLKGRDPYCILVIFAWRKFSRISRYSRNSRKFHARENLLFYSIYQGLIWTGS